MAVEIRHWVGFELVVRRRREPDGIIVECRITFGFRRRIDDDARAIDAVTGPKTGDVGRVGGMFDPLFRTGGHDRVRRGVTPVMQVPDFVVRGGKRVLGEAKQREPQTVARKFERPFRMLREKL